MHFISCRSVGWLWKIDGIEFGFPGIRENSFKAKFCEPHGTYVLKLALFKHFFSTFSPLDYKNTQKIVKIPTNEVSRENFRNFRTSEESMKKFREYFPAKLSINSIRFPSIGNHWRKMVLYIVLL